MATASRVRYRTRSIESLKAGDMVLARDEFDASAPLVGRRVEILFKRTAYHLRILTLRSSSGESHVLKTTNEHPMYTAESEWTPAGQIEVGQRILEASGSVAVVEATEFEDHPRGIDVFNLRVADGHTYLVRAEGFDGEPVWVHNYNDDSLYQPTARAAHDYYAKQVLEDLAGEQRVTTPWAEGNTGVRKYDGFDPETLTGFEANTTPWEQLTVDKYNQKLTQIETDAYLLKNGSNEVKQVIWFGTHALYDAEGNIAVSNPLARHLAYRLQAANIPYYQVTV